MELLSLVSLRANQRTVLAITTNGRIFITQPDAESSVRVLEGSEPRPTALTPNRIAQTLGEPEATGSIRSIVAMPNGELLAYYRGATRRSGVSALVAFDPVSETIRVAVDAAKLEKVSTMGLSLALADAQLVRAGAAIWVSLRHVDQSVVFALDQRQITSGDISSWRPIRTFRLDEGTLTLRPDDALFGQPDGTVWILRPATGELYRLTPEARAFGGAPKDRRPLMSVVPIVLPASGKQKPQRLAFYPFDELPADPLTTPDMALRDATRYPAFVLSTADSEFVLERDAMIVRPAFPTYAMRLTTWLLDPAGDGVVAYDGMSGEILRIRFRGL